MCNRSVLRSDEGEVTEWYCSLSEVEHFPVFYSTVLIIVSSWIWRMGMEKKSEFSNIICYHFPQIPISVLSLFLEHAA